jgi:hypothetical protein
MKLSLNVFGIKHEEIEPHLARYLRNEEKKIASIFMNEEN